MAGDAYKVLGQIDIAVLNVAQDFPAVPSGAQWIPKSFVVVNRSTAVAYIEALVRPAGASAANQHYIVAPLTPINPGTTVTLPAVPMAATDKLTVKSSTTGVNFGLYGVERT